MKTLIVYYSMTGNVKFAAEKLSALKKSQAKSTAAKVHIHFKIP